MIRKLIGWLATWTQNTIYMPRTWRLRASDQLHDLAARRGNRATPISVAATAIVCAGHRHIEPGMQATVDLTGVTDRGEELGDYEVIIRRIR